MMDAICTGTLWFQDRLASSGAPVDSICQECGLEPETEQHLFWECRSIRALQVDEITNTKHMEESAIKQLKKPVATHSAYWLRGLLSTNHIDIPDPTDNDDDTMAYHNDFSPDQELEGTICTDGSGGGQAAARLRRVYWGFV